MGVSYIVGNGGVAMPVPESELLNIKRTVEAGGRPISYLSIGQFVRVEVGPLAGIEGLLVRAAGRDRLVVSVNLLQRSVAVNISKEQVRAIDHLGYV
jgi:transcription antitermination factor NusG